MVSPMRNMLDTKGRPISKKKINRSMLYSLIGGSFGSVWFLFASAQQLLILLVKNHLGASSAELGLFLGAMNLVSIFHLAAIVIYAHRKTIKPFYLTMGFIHRSHTFLIAAASFYAAAGGDKRLCLYIVMGSSIMTYILANTAGSGWWTWINQLLPSNRRSSYFGKRSAAAQTANIIAFFTATIMLDLFSDKVFFVFGCIYTIAAISGLTEHILNIPIPEPASAQDNKAPFKTASFFQPLFDKNFRRFCIVAGLSLLGIMVSAPFFVPMITDPAQIGAPVTWLGIMFAISQLVWILVIPFWGTMMDRFGRKPVTMIGMLSPFTYIGYLFLTPSNYHILLPIIALTGGIFSPALFEGLNQVMLSLLPKKNQTAYIAWYWASLGVIQGLGPIIGGYLLQITGSIQIPVYTTLLIIILAFIMLNSIQIGKELKFRRLVSTISSPSIIRAYVNMPIIGKSTNRAKVGNALKNMKTSQGSLAMDEIIIRLEDADDDVREEAVKALGRIGGETAEEVLISNMCNPESTVRDDCAKSLGLLNSVRAVPFLIDMLNSNDEKLVKTSVRALGRIDSKESTRALMSIIHEPRSIMLKVTSAESLSVKQERMVILHEILKLCEQTSNAVIKKQLYISVGNIVGRPGEFYTYLTGTEQAREDAVQRLFRSISRHLKSLERTKKGLIDHIIIKTLPSAINHFDMEDAEGTFKDLNIILMNLIYREITFYEENDTLSSEHIEILSKEAPRLYAAYILLVWYRSVYKDDITRISQEELLLLFYALKYYRVPQQKLSKGRIR